jgi:hypothetical protein
MNQTSAPYASAQKISRKGPRHFQKNENRFLKESEAPAASCGVSSGITA